VATGLLLLLALAGIAGCGKDADDAKDKDPDKTAAAPARDSNHVAIAADVAAKAGITTGVSGPATIDLVVELPGEVKADSGRVLVVRPRFAGIVHEVRKQVGDAVQKGEVIATIQSNESLSDYTVTSGIAGRVVARGATTGESVTPDVALFTIVDLTDVWVEFPVYPHQIGLVRRGQVVHITRQAGGGQQVDAKVDYVGSVLAEDTRVSVARVVLANRDGRWDPGLFVNAAVVTDHAQVPVAVPDDAIVRTADGNGVFVQDHGGFVLRPVVQGRSDGRTTEIKSGLAAGQTVAVTGAFVLKAELEKSAEGD
jgi:cobalt-zinc-cadmium efflux system membrane fusion protein